MMLLIKPYPLLIILISILLSLIVVSIVGVLLYVYRIRNSKRIKAKKLVYSDDSSSSTKKNPRHLIPLKKLFISSENKPSKIVCRTPSPSSYNDYSIETPTNYQAFDFAKRYQSQASSDSSLKSSKKGQFIKFDSVKSRFQQKVHQRLSIISLFNNKQQQKTVQSYADCGNENVDHSLPIINSDKNVLLNDQSSLTEHLHLNSIPSPIYDQSDSDIEQTPIRLTKSSSKLNVSQLDVSSYNEYSLSELFRIEIRYYLYYDLTQRELYFQLLRLQHLNSIEKCFRTFICKIRLYTGGKRGQRYFSKIITEDITNNNLYQSNEIFKFQLDQQLLFDSYLKINILGYQKNERIELGQTLLMFDQHEKLMINNSLEEYRKFVQIYDDKIDLITQQVEVENEARALICLVYENERCLLQVGIIKASGILSLVKQQHGLIHMKICTVCDNKVTCKKKSKSFVKITNETVFTYSTSFHLEYLSLHKTCMRISICLKPTSLSPSKLLGKIEFGSNCLKTVSGFQHWSDTLSAPNKPHIGWHTFEKIN